MASFIAFCGACITVLKELNTLVDEPYMDEPFHIPQAQAYCNGDFEVWDPKITTPPGLYLMSLLLKRLFLFKCNVPMLRLTVTLTLLALPIILARLLAFHKRFRPPASLLNPPLEAVIISFFPIAWFFGFLYYTEVPSLLFVVGTVVAASEDNHWLAAFLGLLSCTFRQTNILWVLYAYASSQLMYLRFRRLPAGGSTLHDPPALEATPGDLIRSVLSLPNVIPELLQSFIPYTLVLLAFGVFVIWNGGIVLGDKANHIPVFHVPQLYYFIGFSTAFGWPVLLGSKEGLPALLHEVRKRMIGSKPRVLITLSILLVMSVTTELFTIQHPFLLSDNRHYTFYIWRRVYMLHPVVPHLLTPLYLICAWAWFLRVGREQSLLQTISLPILAVFTLLPTPLLEPRYFLIPYVLMRAQISDMPDWALHVEGAWYLAINAVTMVVFIYFPRENVGRFMW